MYFTFNFSNVSLFKSRSLTIEVTKKLFFPFLCEFHTHMCTMNTKQGLILNSKNKKERKKRENVSLFSIFCFTSYIDIQQRAMCMQIGLLILYFYSHNELFILKMAHLWHLFFRLFKRARVEMSSNWYTSSRTHFTFIFILWAFFILSQSCCASIFFFGLVS
jgi:hypothetical protein